MPGVRISGREDRAGTLELRVAGPSAARGRVRVTGRGRLSGRLGGRRVRARLANRPPHPLGFGTTFGQVATVSPPPALP